MLASRMDGRDPALDPQPGESLQAWVARTGATAAPTAESPADMFNRLNAPYVAKREEQAKSCQW